MIKGLFGKYKYSLYYLDNCKLVEVVGMVFMRFDDEFDDDYDDYEDDEDEDE